MLEHLLSDVAFVGFGKFQLSKKFDCRENYAIVCYLSEKERPWEYPYPKVVINTNSAMSVSAMSSTPFISISLI